MAINEGDVVKLKRSGRIGRVCKLKGGITACVQFEGIGCRRTVLVNLEPASGNAPDCSEKCNAGNC